MPPPLSDTRPRVTACPKCLWNNNLPEGQTVGLCQNCGHTVNHSQESKVTFKVNGNQYEVPNTYDATMSLNEYLRDIAHLSGSKVMCREGGCGCCVVAATYFDPLKQKKKTVAVNSCLCPVYAINGWDITTTEGLGSQKNGFHAIQERVADYNGSQCGFCTPGMVMNMYSLLSEVPKPSKAQVENAFDGNICRCTGFRPILDAFKSFSPDANTSDLQHGTIDIEDLSRLSCTESAGACQGQGHCGGQGQCHKSRLFALALPGCQWYSPTSIANLYVLLGQLKVQRVRMVYGNTSVGVYKNDGPFDVYIDIKGVTELYQTKIVAGDIRFGANVTLSALTEGLQQAEGYHGYEYCGCLSEHLDRVANLPVRNVGSWAGNMMIKHQHREFPSDVFVVMETVGAKIQIGGDDDVSEVLPSEFLDMDMDQKVIEALLMPRLEDNEHVRTYKIMPRSQNAHAYVNAGFKVQLDSNDRVTGTPTIVYGGINPEFIHAKATEQFLVNKTLSDEQTLQGALKVLQGEVKPSDDPVLATATYRRNLAVSLFYKFVLDVCSNMVSDRLKSGATILKRPVSSGRQNYDTDSSEWPLTKPIPKLTSKLQASGEAQYMDDLPPLPGELHAAFVVTTQGNATVASVDTSAALAATGVIKYLSSSDIPEGGANNFAITGSEPEEVFCTGKVLYAGQAVGIIVADTQVHADEAVKKVKVTYTDIKPPILTIEDAIEKKSFFPAAGPDLKKGDAEKAIASSDKVIKGAISMGTQYHFTMETQGCRVVPNEGGFEVHATTQWVDTVQTAIARVLGINISTIQMQVRRLGGAYGSKITRNSLISTACAVAANNLNKPVRMSLNLQTNMEMVGKRCPYMAQYEVGVSNEGKLQGIKITYYCDCGSSPNDNTVMAAVGWADNGSAPSVFITESIMEHVAKELKMDPLELRTINLYKKGQMTHQNQPLPYCNISSLVDQLSVSATISQRKAQAAAFNQANRWKKRGVSTVPLKYGVSWVGGYFNVFVTVYNSDGSVAISHGGIEAGQGINTKVTQVCAFKLGIDMELVTVRPTSDLASSNSQATGSSVASELCCLGVVKCCEALLARMAPVRQKLKDPSWPQLVQECFAKGIDLSARQWVYPTSEYPFNYQAYGVTCTEVELDVLTGESQILRSDILYDCGKSMNPDVDIGQAEGAFVMGLGYWRSEQIKYDPTSGVNLTNGTWEYKPPASQDIPVDFRVSLLKDAPNPLGVLSSKAVGEPPLCMACSALFALKHAIEAARTDAGKDSYFRLDGPATPEKAQIECLCDISQFVLK